MAKWSMQERVKIIEFFYVSHRSIVATQEIFCDHFNAATAPNAKMTRNLINRFEKRGAVFDRPLLHRPVPVRNEKIVQSVRDSGNNYSSVASGRLGTPLRISKTSLRRVLKTFRIRNKNQLVKQILR